MKRKDLIKLLENNGWTKVREAVIMIYIQTEKILSLSQGIRKLRKALQKQLSRGGG